MKALWYVLIHHYLFSFRSELIPSQVSFLMKPASPVGKFEIDPNHRTISPIPEERQLEDMPDEGFGKYI